jgi:hypothetical protein
LAFEVETVGYVKDCYPSGATIVYAKQKNGAVEVCNLCLLILLVSFEITLDNNCYCFFMPFNTIIDNWKLEINLENFIHTL